MTQQELVPASFKDAEACLTTAPLLPYVCSHPKHIHNTVDRAEEEDGTAGFRHGCRRPPALHPRHRRHLKGWQIHSTNISDVLEFSNDMFVLIRSF